MKNFLITIVLLSVGLVAFADQTAKTVHPSLMSSNPAADLIKAFDGSIGNIPPLAYGAVPGNCDNQKNNSHCYQLEPNSKVSDFLPANSALNRFVVDLSDGNNHVITYDKTTPVSFLAYQKQNNGGPLAPSQPILEFLAELHMYEFGVGAFVSYERVPSTTGLVYKSSSPGNTKYIEFRQYDAKNVIFVTYPMIYWVGSSGYMICSSGHQPVNGRCTIGYFWAE